MKGLSRGSRIRAGKEEFEVEEFAGAGGQAEVYRLRGPDGPSALKLFYERYSGREDEERVRWIVDQRLWTRSKVLRATPRRWLRVESRLAHISEWVDGRTVEEELGSDAAPWSLPQALEAAAVLAQGIRVCEELGIAQGDISANNVKVELKDSLLRLFPFDFDNFAVKDLPPPRMMGTKLYLAPELTRGDQLVPTLESDRYALGVLVHELLLLQHPKNGHDSAEDEFDKAVLEGRWHQDPSLPKAARGLGGLPAQILSVELQRLFRDAQGSDPVRRPHAAKWVESLERARWVVWCCEHEDCGGHYVVDLGKDHCPLCDRRPTSLGARVDGRLIRFDGPATLLGRAELRDSRHVSKRHALVRRVGPEYLFVDLSSSGSWKRTGDGLERLARGRDVLIQAGDRLRLGDVEVRIERS
jgi:serine/threonine protein kinase